MSKIIAAVVLSALLAIPTLTQAREGYRANAQAPNPSGDMSVDSTRMSPAQALRDCSALEQKWAQAALGLAAARRVPRVHGPARPGGIISATIDDGPAGRKAGGIFYTLLFEKFPLSRRPD